MKIPHTKLFEEIYRKQWVRQNTIDHQGRVEGEKKNKVNSTEKKLINPTRSNI